MSRLFSQSTDKLQAGAAGNTAQDNYTMFALVKPINTSGGYIIYNGNGVDSGAGYGMDLVSGTLQAHVDLSFVAAYNSGLFAKLGMWNAVLYRRRAGTSHMFVNGKKATATSGSESNGISAFYTIGARPNSSGVTSSPFNGVIAETALWNRALSDAEAFYLTRRLRFPSAFKGGLSQYHKHTRARSTEVSVFAGNTLTATGTLEAEHPQLLVPTPIRSFLNLGKAPSATVVPSRMLMGVGV
jgi:hypothetical protein